MSKAGKILLIIGSVWMILVCGYGFYILYQTRTVTEWVKAATPPEPLASLKVEEGLGIFAETETGSLYEFSFYPNYEWNKVTQPDADTPRDFHCTQGEATVPNPPDAIKSHASMDCFHAEVRFHNELALLENGEVWYMEVTDNSYVTLGRIFVGILMPIACVPGILVIVIGLILLIVSMTKK